jgi:pyruvate dehydrogenase E1 component alpha subunit
MAMTWKLPVIFICENNYYAMGTSVERTSNVLDIYKFADAYDMPGDSVDGMKPEDVHESIERAARRARDGQGPTLLEIKTYRYKGHSMSDPAKYRTKEELEEYKEKDPIEHVRKVLLDQQFATEADIEAINDKVKAIVDDSVDFAEKSPFPDVNELYKDIYTDENYPFILD